MWTTLRGSTPGVILLMKYLVSRLLLSQLSPNRGWNLPASVLLGRFHNPQVDSALPGPSHRVGLSSPHPAGGNSHLGITLNNHHANALVCLGLIYLPRLTTHSASTNVNGLLNICGRAAVQVLSYAGRGDQQPTTMGASTNGRVVSAVAVVDVPLPLLVTVIVNASARYGIFYSYSAGIPVLCLNAWSRADVTSSDVSSYP